MDYSAMYYLLFNAISDALKEMQKQNIGIAKEILEQAQIRCEELYMNAEDQSCEDL